MKPLTPPIRWPLLAVLVLALSACGRQDDDDELGAATRQDATAAERAQASADTAITARVRTALAADEQLRATQITVDTRNGQVTMTGVVPDAQSRERATTLASAVDGVKLINNQVAIGRSG
ncbi:BON domain-containing protein [Roseateles saccharophilus]|uniref:BON domain-containing protein n=1 Tax=Roseateles saccharophilus TaxID=304 RepID=A0A4V2VS57_ROSSA|nr:BON domain-containing protein [Roseateles saccharophilus]MDG0835922.1 BON domain-containing protein [Roseateles saccharophilus]TCV01110.1 BON domain-containing protein [Roseateles saccharophilus]